MSATLPWAWYADPEVLRREQERIFRSAWQYVGAAARVQVPTQFFTSRIGDIPIVVVHDRDDGLNAFLNVCRHRGSVLVEGEGQRETLQCPYHAWTYGFDGTLRAAPRAEREGDFDRESLSLRRVQIAQWGPFLFANPDLDAPPFAETLRDLPERIAQAGIDVDALELRLRTESSVEANWKITAENFLECYHCAVAHPGFSEVVDVRPDSYRLEVGETFSTQVGELRHGAVARAVPRGQFHLIWPNTTINIFPGQPNLSIGPILPAGPGRTERFLDYFFAADADEAWVEELLEFDGQVGREDRELVERVQRGVSSGVLDEGRLLPQSEALVADFQQRIAAAIS